MNWRNTASIAALLIGTAASSSVAMPPLTEMEAAHGEYVTAINSNDVETVMAILTDDIIYQAPGAPEVVGKAAVRQWIEGYMAAYRIKWEKTSIGFTLSGDWAIDGWSLDKPAV